MNGTSYLDLDPRSILMTTENDCPKKHPCPDCVFCQWCADERCQLCLRQCPAGGKKLSLQEQIELYEALNKEEGKP